jgi:hypothetical protein
LTSEGRGTREQDQNGIRTGTIGVPRRAATVAPSRDHTDFLAISGKVVSRIFASWNQLDGWLRQVEGLRRVA